MKKLFCTLIMFGMTAVTYPVLAQSAAPAAKKETAKKEAPKKTLRKKASKKAAAKATAAAAVAAAASSATADGDDDEDLGEANIDGSTVTHYNCELGNKVTTYINDSDDIHMAIRWKEKVHRLRRVGTSTGANRFENRKFGLVWINIPAKSMLLDSKKGQQLANECRNPDQTKAQTEKI